MVSRSNMTNQKIIDLYEKGFSLRNIARLAGVSYQNIHQRLTTAKARRSGAITRDPRYVSPEESEIIKRLYVFGVPSIEVAEMVSLSDISVHRRLVKLNVRRRTPTEARFIKRLPIPDELMAKV